MPNSTRRVLVASLAGTTIEFFDFYIYAQAAVLVFPAQFFPKSDPLAGTLNSLAAFSLAFLARPLGSLIFGHFGDRLGRKATLVTALLTMGLSTFAIGLLPTFASIGVLAPLFLAICRVGQGIGLGGEWGGAVLLATENAPPGKAAWYGMFPQQGAPLGYILAGGAFLILSTVLSDAQFHAFGWRLPFLASSALVGIGLYVRLNLAETPAFASILERQERERIPIATLCRNHSSRLILGVLSAFSAFVIFYLLSVFTLTWATSKLGYTRSGFLLMQMVGMVGFSAAIAGGALWAERGGRKRVLLISNVGVLLFGLVFGRLFGAGGAGVMTLLVVGFVLMGLNYGPLGTFLAELFPTSVRYTGASLAFNAASIIGASATPFLALTVAKNYGVAWVGYYLAASAAVTLVALLAVG